MLLLVLCSWLCGLTRGTNEVPEERKALACWSSNSTTTGVDIFILLRFALCLSVLWYSVVDVWSLMCLAYVSD